MRVKDIYPVFCSTPAPVSTWWLSGGITESTDYTIYDPANAASEATSYINLANPGTRNAVPYNSPTWTSGVGWSGNATDMYFDTQTTYGPNHTVIVMFKDPTSGRFLVGALQGTPNRTASVIPQSSTNINWNVAGTFVSSASRHLGGTIGFTMTDGFRNGVKDTSVSFTWSGSQTTTTIKLLAYDNGAISSYNAATIHRVAIYNIKLSDSQILDVSNAMLEIGESSLHSYSDDVLALNPVYYAPMNVKSGYMFVKDYSGSGVPATHIGSANSWGGGTVGQYGNAVECDGSANAQIHININSNYTNLRNFNIDECSISMWINFTYSAPFTHKIIEIWRTGLNEYVAWEVRATDKFGYFIKTNGVTQSNSNMFAGATGWHHIVMYNSVSNNVVGMYYDGVKYEEANNLGSTVTSTNQLFEIGILDGSLQHVAIFDRLLNQTEVNSLQ